MPIHLLHVVGARPNFMKLAPVYRALDGRARQTIVHTGQHYDSGMSEIFFQELTIPTPDTNLEVGSRSHAVQTAEIMMRLEPVLLDRQPDFVLVYGDVNSTVAAALVCSKLGIKVAHIEAGLRSGDWTMPEEINRRVTDVLADVLFTPSQDGNENLAAEGVPAQKVHLVGNVMIDCLVHLLPTTDPPGTRERLNLDKPYVLVTLHRPSNVDDVTMLRGILDALADISRHATIVFPVHPRTREKMAQLSIPTPKDVRLVEPLGYLEFLSLQQDASVVVTDSGGVQEETTFLGVPCITVRQNTERPITVSQGTNILIGNDMKRLRTETLAALNGQWRKGAIPPLWDGHAGSRIAEILLSV